MELSGVLNGLYSRFGRREVEPIKRAASNETRTLGCGTTYINSLFTQAIDAYNSVESSYSLDPLFFAYGAFRLLKRQNGELLKNFVLGDTSIAELVDHRLSSFEYDLKDWETKKQNDYSHFDIDLLDFLADVVHSRISSQTTQKASKETEMSYARVEGNSLDEYIKTVFPIIDHGEVNSFYMNKNTRTTRRDLIGLERALRTTQYMNLEVLVVQWLRFKELTKNWESDLQSNFQSKKIYSQASQDQWELKKAA